GGRVLRDVLLRGRDPLLPRALARRLRGPRAEPPGAGAVLVLVRLGAEAPASRADRHRRGSRHGPARPATWARRLHRQRLRVRRRARDPASPPVRREPLAERSREPGAPRGGARSDPDAAGRSRRARHPDIRRITFGYVRRPLPAHVLPTARVPEA